VPYSVLNRKNICVLSGWLEGNSKKEMCENLTEIIDDLEKNEGRGCEVGGGDGLGSIILPGPLPVDNSHPILRWPN
jgi:hypothetical protein